MKILLLGATGRTGIHVLHEALQRAHTVTALVRDASALDATLTAAQRSSLTILRGSPLNAADVAAAVATAVSHNEDRSGEISSSPPSLAVISTLNPRRGSDNPWAAPHPTDSPPRMMADSIANVLAAVADIVRAGGRAKVVHLSAIGVGASAAHAPWMLRAVVAHSNMRLTYADHEAVEAELRAAAEGERGVAWVSVRANRLVEGSDKSVARVWRADDGKGTVGVLAASSRRAVAKFLLEAAEKSEWDGTAPVITG